MGRRAEEVCGERDAELSGVQVHLHTLETDNQEQVRGNLCINSDEAVFVITLYLYMYSI